MQAEELKQCIVCRRVKAGSQFSSVKQNKDGLSGDCKDCEAAYQQIYRAGHREEKAAYDQAYYAENLGKIATQKRAYYAGHTEEKAIYNRTYRADNHEEIVAQQRDYRAKNSEEINAKKRASYAENPEKDNAQSRDWRKRNPEKINAHSRLRRARIAGATTGTIDYDAAWLRDKGRCCICVLKVDRRLKHPHPMSLSWDHTVPLSKDGMHTQENVRVCHLRCNLLKGVGRLPVQQVLV